jgi:hypothetical protein
MHAKEISDNVPTQIIAANPETHANCQVAERKPACCSEILCVAEGDGRKSNVL